MIEHLPVEAKRNYAEKDIKYIFDIYRNHSYKELPQRPYDISFKDNEKYTEKSFDNFLNFIKNRTETIFLKPALDIYSEITTY